MSHEKVFGFCENLCEVEVEKTSNKVTSMSSSSTDEQYPSAKAVYDVSNTFEQKSNKVTHISSSSTDEQYPSAKSVYGMLTNFLCGEPNGVWSGSPMNCANWYFYEGADTTLYYLPTANCIVLVFKKTATRGVAFAFGWDGVSTNKSLWKNTNQDGWRGWISLHS